MVQARMVDINVTLNAVISTSLLHKRLLVFIFEVRACKVADLARSSESVDNVVSRNTQTENEKYYKISCLSRLFCI
jgi:hypothetical protein